MSFSRKTISIISASAIALGTCIPAGLAFADPDPVDPPSVGDQSGAGSTALTMVWDNADTEYGGTEDPNNPPSDPNDPTSPGENLAFKAPTAINFVAKANGDLIAPSYSAVYLENFSASGIHVSSMQIEQGTGWNIVEDAASSANTANAVWGKIGPYNERLNWYDHKSKTDVTTASKWGMAAAGAANDQSKLFLATEGKFANLNIDLSEAKTFGTIHWYLKMGGEGQRAVDPATVHTLNKPTVASSNGGFKLKTSLAAAAISEDLGEAVEGDTVYIVAEPKIGNKVEDMEVTQVSDDTSIEVTRNVGGDPNVGSFTMPEESVDVNVTFEIDPIAPKDHVNLYTMGELKAISEDIRENGEDSIYYSTFNSFAQNGENVVSTLHDGVTNNNATLVDASEGYGLVFMLDRLPEQVAHYTTSTNSKGWTESNIRTSLSAGGTLYNKYLDGMTMRLSDVEEVVEPAGVTLISSAWYPKKAVVENSTFFIPSVTEIYGDTVTQGAWPTNGKEYEAESHQFAYFASLNMTTTNHLVLTGDNGVFTKCRYYVWTMRSFDTANTNFVWNIQTGSGSPTCQAINTAYSILPCFCL